MAPNVSRSVLFALVLLDLLATLPPKRLPEPLLEDNAALVVWLIARCALAREESRGAHFRTDYPKIRTGFARHSYIQENAEITFR